jgi:hypothetical protein
MTMTWTCGSGATQSPEFYREQATACRNIARLQIHPAHRATFLRLALHWRQVAHSVADIVDRPAQACDQAP